MSTGPGQKKPSLATKARPQPPPLAERIFDEGHLFDFFQLVHLLERWQQAAAGIGGSGPYSGERLRFRPDPALVFSAADVLAVEAQKEPSSHTLLTICFMGLYGVASPSPVYFSELIGFSDVDAEPLTDFLDLFNHRLISFYYRAWVKYRYPYRYELGAEDEISRELLSFIGLGEPAVAVLARLPVWRLLRYIGLLAPQTRPPVSLCLLLTDYFGGVPVSIEELVPRWVTVPEDQRNQLGAANSSLGSDLTVGARVLDRAGKLRIVIGPLTYDEYRCFLPGTGKFQDLNALVRLWVHERLDYDFELRLHRHEVPQLQMTAEQPPQIGWTSWVLAGDGGLGQDPGVIFQRLRAEQYQGLAQGWDTVPNGGAS